MWTIPVLPRRQGTHTSIDAGTVRTPKDSGGGWSGFASWGTGFLREWAPKAAEFYLEKEKLRALRKQGFGVSQPPPVRRKNVTRRQIPAYDAPPGLPLSSYWTRPVTERRQGQTRPQTAISTNAIMLGGAAVLAVALLR